MLREREYDTITDIVTSSMQVSVYHGPLTKTEVHEMFHKCSTHVVEIGYRLYEKLWSDLGEVITEREMLSENMED